MALIDFSPRRSRDKAQPWMVRFADETGVEDRKLFDSKSAAWRYLIDEWGL